MDDPHQAPPSLLAFAIAAGQDLRTALEDGGAASAYLERIEAAVLRVPLEVPETVAATYLDHASELAARFPVLESRTAFLRRSVSSRVLRLMLNSR